jgi:hypothetical protein
MSLTSSFDAPCSAELSGESCWSCCISMNVLPYVFYESFLLIGRSQL